MISSFPANSIIIISVHFILLLLISSTHFAKAFSTTFCTARTTATARTTTSSNCCKFGSHRYYSIATTSLFASPSSIPAGFGSNSNNGQSGRNQTSTPPTTTSTSLSSSSLSSSIATEDVANSLNQIQPSADDKDQQRRYATLRIQGPDTTGIVAAFAQTLAGHGCSIYDAEQSTDRSAGLFFQRIRFDYTGMITDQHTLQKGIDDVCTRLNMKYQLNWGNSRKKIAIFVSKYDHCLWELILRHRANELCNSEISMIISNHEDLKSIADAFHIPFYLFPVTKETKQQQEDKEIKLLQAHNIDLIILARYMQIISDNFCNTFQHKVINIHHSFLPAFIGSRPYHRAHERGVKLIGATAHYATADLDEGPIIEQDTTRISHQDDVNDLLRKGRTLEKNVLISAIRAHLDDRVIVYGNKCVVFGS